MKIVGETHVYFQQTGVRVWSSAPRSLRDILNEALRNEKLRRFNLSPSNVSIKRADFNFGFVELYRKKVSWDHLEKK